MLNTHGGKDTGERSREKVEEILSTPGYGLADEVRRRIMEEIPGVID